MMRPSPIWWARPRRLAPIVVVSLALLGTITAVSYVHRTAVRRDQERFQEAIRATQLAIQKRMEAYTAILRATSGMFSGEVPVTRREFEAYVERLQLRENYPGTLGLGYAERVEPEALGSFVEQMQQVYPGYEVLPESTETMYPIKFIEPLDWRNQRAMGYDMFNDRDRRRAMERARDNGEAAATTRVTLVQETEENPQPGFLMYVPVYSGIGVPETQESRRERIMGFAYAPLRIPEMLEGIFEAADPEVEFLLFARSPAEGEAPLYDSDPLYTPAERGVLRQRVELTLAGELWTLELATRPAFMAASEVRLVPVVAAIGGLLTLAFFAITLSLSRAWMQMEAAAAELTVSRDELRELAERFRVAIKNAPLLVYNTDLDLRYTWIVNPPAGIAVEQFLGRRDEEIFGPAEAAPLEEIKQRVLRTGVGIRRELPLKIAGELRFYDLTIEPLRDAWGKLLGLTAAAIDVTDLRQAYDKFRLASQAVRSLIYDWDVATGRISRTEGMMDVLGVRPEDAEPSRQWWLERIHPDDLERFESRTRWAMAHEQRYMLEYRMRHAEGHWVDVWDHGVIVRNDEGRITSVVGNVLNVSEMKKAQRALVQHAEELERSNSDLQDFAYIASHDLKEPLRGIANYAKFLEEDQAPLLDDEGRERLQTIQRLCQHMYGLLDSLLEFSRVGRTKLAVTEVDLNQVVHDVVVGLGPWLEQERGEVRQVERLPVLRADRVRIGQVFSNLIANGVKYNDGPVRIVEVGAMTIPDEPGPVIFIRDNGIGIPERHKDKLFRMFKRLHPRTQYGGGTGSGLAIAKKIVERHGGRIWLQSEAGKGTTFFFTLRPAQGGMPNDGEQRQEGEVPPRRARWEAEALTSEKAGPA
jgi:PAS domain S-box-containing protein